MSDDKIFMRTAEQENILLNNTYSKQVYKDTGENINSLENKQTTLLSNTKSLSYKELYNMLLAFLSGNTILLRKVLELARIMVNAGVRPDPEDIITIAKYKSSTIHISRRVGNNIAK